MSEQSLIERIIASPSGVRHAGARIDYGDIRIETAQERTFAANLALAYAMLKANVKEVDDAKMEVYAYRSYGGAE